MRSVFIAHWVDNAFAGAALEGGAKGVFINIFNRFQTGHYIRTGPCPHPEQGEEVTTLSPVEISVLTSFFPATKPIAAEGMPTYPPGKQCNSKGLTPLGAYLVRQLIANHILIEVDHLSEKARERVLEIAAAHDYPLVSSHTDTGGLLDRRASCASSTGSAGSRPRGSTRRRRSHRRSRSCAPTASSLTTSAFRSEATPAASRTCPAPRADAAERPLAYPFNGYKSKVSFDREVSGERSFDLNTDGMAHYGLLADLLADMQRTPGSKRAMRMLFRSAAAYLAMWKSAGGG